MTIHGIPLPSFISIALLLLCLMAPSTHCARPSVCVGNIFGGAPECDNCLWVTNGQKHCYRQWSKSMCLYAGDQYTWCEDDATATVAVTTEAATPPATTQAATLPATTQAATPPSTTQAAEPATTTAPSTTELATTTTIPPVPEGNGDALTLIQRNKCNLEHCSSCWIKMTPDQIVPQCLGGEWDQRKCETANHLIFPASVQSAVEKFWCGARATTTTTTTTPPPPTPRDPRCPSTCTGCETRWRDFWHQSWRTRCEGWMTEQHCDDARLGDGKDAYWCPAAAWQHQTTPPPTTRPPPPPSRPMWNFAGDSPKFRGNFF